jgi:hypothetical protein
MSEHSNFSLTTGIPHAGSPADRAAFHRVAWAATLAALGVYLLTLAPDLTWANAAIDGGELITASATLGIPHPPGYPVYVLLGKLFSLLPLGGVAFRYNLFSAVAAAGAVGLAVLIIASLYPRVRPMTALAAALLLGFSPLVWSQAVVAEVYALNLLLLAAFLLAWSRGAVVWSGLWLGLAMTTHLTSLLMLPLLIFGGRQKGRSFLGLSIGLSPLLLLPLLARGGSPVVWGQPTSAAGWWWLVSGQLYSANFRLETVAERLPVLLAALALGPAIVAGRAWRPAIPAPPAAGQSTRPQPTLLAGTAALFSMFILFYATPDAAVLLLPALLLLTLLIPPLMGRLGPWALLLPLALAVIGYSGQNLRYDAGPRGTAVALLRSAPPRAVLMTPGDRTIFTLWYFHHVEGLRPDVRLVDANLFAFDWYRRRLDAHYPDLAVPAGDDLDALRLNNAATRPFCTVGLVASEATAANPPRIQPTIDCHEGVH